MQTFKIFKHETVTSVAEVEAETQEQALKFARASQGLPQEPKYTETQRRNARLSLTDDITRERKPKEQEVAQA